MLKHTKYILSVPSKTFLLGEYGVTANGPAILISTGPRFELTVEPHTGVSLGLGVMGVSKNSPAAKYFQEQTALLKPYQLHFYDPYAGQGGFGSSSAQFLLLFLAAQALQQGAFPDTEDETSSRSLHLPLSELMETYKRCAWSGQGIKPSGADMVGQFMGDITQFDQENGDLVTQDWPFKDLSFFLIPTANKVATHEHLETLSSMDFSQLIKITQKATQPLEKAQSKPFIACLRAFADELQKLNLVLPQTQEALNLIRSQPFVLAAKGCGALGADVLLVMCERDKRHVCEQWLHQNQFTPIASEEELEPGFQLTMEVSMPDDDALNSETVH